MKNFDKFLNIDYRIVVEKQGNFKSRKEKRHLIGRKGLIKLIGIELYQKAVNRAYRANLPKITIKLRRGISIIFYQK